MAIEAHTFIPPLQGKDLEALKREALSSHRPTLTALNPYKDHFFDLGERQLRLTTWSASVVGPTIGAIFELDTEEPPLLVNLLNQEVFITEELEGVEPSFTILARFRFVLDALARESVLSDISENQ